MSAGKEAKLFVHQLRAENQAILIGSNTAINDNPSLTTRLVDGKSPLRIVLSSNKEKLHGLKVLTDNNPTLILSGSIEEVLNELHKNDIQSLIVEGGQNTLQSFIDNNLWDEALQFIGEKEFSAGTKAPKLVEFGTKSTSKMGKDLLNHYIR